MSRKTIKETNEEMKFKKFETLVALPIPQKAVLEGVVGLFQNNRYTISIKQVGSDAFVGPDGNPTKLSHLAVVDKWGKGVPYEDRIKIKKELCGNNAEMVELYPGEWREQHGWDGYHFWCLPVGAMFPLGFVPNNPEEAIMKSGGILGDGIGINQSDLELYAICTDGVTEVFADLEDAKELYAQAGIDELPHGSIVQIVSAPQEGIESVGWSQKAQAKRDRIVARYSNSIPELFGDEMGDIIASGDPVEYADGPNTIEDRIALSEEMRIGITDKRESRAEDLEKACAAATEEIEVEKG